MSNRLSFAQILQKKKESDSTGVSRISTSRVGHQQSYFGSQVSSQYCGSALPSLADMMNEYTQFPEGPQQNYALNFSQQQNQEEMNGSQDFGSGLNPLDSWIMSQSNFNNQKFKSKSQFPPNNHPMKYSQNKSGKGQQYMNLSKHFNTSKENRNQNVGNIENVFKFSSKTSRRSVENSQQDFIEDSKKYMPTNPISHSRRTMNRQMIGDTKIIQSQVYQNFSPLDSKRDPISTNKMEKSEKVDKKQVTPKRMVSYQLKEEKNYQKISRYQNYQETQRKQDPLPVSQPPKQIQKPKLITLKHPIQKQVKEFGEEKKTDNKGKILKLIRKQTQQQELLTAGLDDAPPIQMQTQNEKRLQDAKRQIQQYLQIKQKNPSALVSEPKFGIDLKTNPKEVLNQVSQICPENSSKLVNYSFAQNQISSESPSDSFAHTKQQLKQIIEENQAQQNERMLSCIEYTQSEAEGSDEIMENNHSIEQLPQYRKNLEVSQSIPQRREARPQKQQFTLQKYLPKDDDMYEGQRMSISPPHMKKQSMSSPREEQVQYSQIVQKIEVAPQQIKIPMVEKDQQSLNVLNSDNPRFRELSSGQILQSIEGPPEKVPYHDVSSIDIHISNGSQSPPSQKQIIIQLKNEKTQNMIIVPKLNLKISDISSVSNYSHPQSHPSPIKCSPIQQSPIQNSNEKSSQVQSNQPMSSHDSINIQAHANGFIYAMRVNSKNNSFTSNYNKSLTHSHSESHCSNSFNHSNRSSLYIKQDDDIETMKFEKNGREEYNMNKNKKFIEIQPYEPENQIIQASQNINQRTVQQPIEQTKQIIVQESIAVARVVVQEEIIQIQKKEAQQQWNGQLVSLINKVHIYQSINIENTQRNEPNQIKANETIIDQLRFTPEPNLSSKQPEFSCEVEIKMTNELENPNQSIEVQLAQQASSPPQFNSAPQDNQQESQYISNNSTQEIKPTLIENIQILENVKEEFKFQEKVNKQFPTENSGQAEGKVQQMTILQAQKFVSNESIVQQQLPQQIIEQPPINDKIEQKPTVPEIISTPQTISQPLSLSFKISETSSKLEEFPPTNPIENKMLEQTNSTMITQTNILSSIDTDIKPIPLITSNLKTSLRKDSKSSITGSMSIKNQSSSSINKKEEFQFDLDF